MKDLLTTSCIKDTPIVARGSTFNCQTTILLEPMARPDATTLGQCLHKPPKRRDRILGARRAKIIISFFMKPGRPKVEGLGLSLHESQDAVVIRGFDVAFVTMILLITCH